MSKAKTKNSKVPKLAPAEKPVSLAPLSFRNAVKALAQTKSERQGK